MTRLTRSSYSGLGLLGCSALLLPACGNGGSSTNLPVQNRAVIVAGDFTPGAPGVMASLDMETTAVTQGVAPNGAVGDDPMIRRFGDELFVVNRADGNNVTILDAITLAPVEQLATGAGSNPQDVAVIGDQLYIPALGTPGVVVVERGTGTTRQIDLSALDAVDGLPDCVSAIALGTRVVVACGLLDNFVANTPGVIAVIDTAAGDAVTTFELLHRNPFGVFERTPDDHLVIPTVPDFVDFSTGCLEEVDVAARTSTCAISNQDIGGFAGRVDFDGDDMYFAVASFGAEGAIGNVQKLDRVTGSHTGALTPSSQVVVDFSICPGNQLVVADATQAANGLRVYVDDAEVTAAPLPIGLAPASNHGISCY